MINVFVKYTKCIKLFVFQLMFFQCTIISHHPPTVFTINTVHYIGGFTVFEQINWIKLLFYMYTLERILASHPNASVSLLNYQQKVRFSICCSSFESESIFFYFPSLLCTEILFKTAMNPVKLSKDGNICILYLNLQTLKTAFPLLHSLLSSFFTFFLCAV